MLDPAEFETMFQGWISDSGCASAAVMPLTRKNTASLSVLEFPPDSAPEYLLKSWDLRRDPLKAYPFAKSLIAAALPFHSLPQLSKLPVSDFDLFNGIIAGYAGMLDYHIAGREAMSSLAEAITKKLSSPLRYEICIDTTPLAERNLAGLSGLGRRGYNDCILCQNEGSGCYLSFLLLDIELPAFIPEEIFPPCPECKRCIQSCPNAVLGGKHFKIEKCISYLSMEKRGKLRPEEAALLGENIFGCSKCTAICPGTKMPDDLKVDLEWLLLSSAGEIRKAIKGSPAEYAGTSLLRRNALYVLKYRNNTRCTDLIKRFQKQSGSDLLKEIAAGLID